MHGRDACPSEHALLELVVEHRIVELSDHLDACDVCREVVAELARRADDGAPTVLDTPAAIGRFEIERVLGAGAMGVVYLARDPRLERKVALKVLHAPSAAKLVDEARAMARLEHDNLVTVYEIEQLDAQLAIAMEYLAGGTLRAWLETPRSWRAIATAMHGVASGLAAIHRAGLLHRDLKPDNILFDANGRARIADLGLATLQGARASLIGTPVYMAPEQLDAGTADERTDQWSFFVCFSEALSGQRPFAGATQAALRAAMTTAPAKPPGPGALQAIVARGLQLDPAARHASMAAVASALERLLRRGTRRVWIAFATAAVAIPSAAAVLMASAAEEPCGRSSEPIAAIWNDATKARIAAAYRAADMPETGAVVTRGLDEITADWERMHADSCRSTHVRGEQSAAMLDRRTVCLRERLASIESLIARLATTDRGVLSRGGEAVAALPAITECDASRLDATTLPSDPRAVAARIELARARTLRPLGEARKVIALVEPLISIGLELRDHVLVAEARLVLADALAADLQLAPAHARYVETELAAEAARDDDLRARALIAHATLVGALQQQPVDAAELLTRARAVIERLGQRPDLGRRLLVAEAALAAARGEPEAGERLLRPALDTFPSTGSERSLRVVALRDLANMLSEQERHAEAVVAAREAVAFAEATLGPDHVDVSETLSLLALTLHFVGEDDEARILVARAIAIKERARGRDHVSLSSTLMVQALIARDSHTASGHAEARRATDRAIALRRAAYAPENPLLLSLVSERGSLAVEAGEYALARESFATAIPGLERAWGAASLPVIQARQSEATMAEHGGDPATCAAQLAAISAVLQGPPRTDNDVQRAQCLILAGSYARAAALIEELRASELAPDARAALDVLSARLSLASGDRGRARAIATDVEPRIPTPELDLALDLALVWAKLGDARRSAELSERALAAAGVDLGASDAYARASEIALINGRRGDAARLAERAMALATAASAGPDLLARYRCLGSAARGDRCDAATSKP